MILVIRISGQVDLAPEVKETLHRIRLRRKFTATLLKDTVENRKLLKTVRNYVAYGNVKNDFIEKLVEMRGEGIANKKFDAKKVASGIDSKSLEELGIKGFFRLHPPIGGIDSKKHFGIKKGVLGDHKEQIIKLAERML